MSQGCKEVQFSAVFPFPVVPYGIAATYVNYVIGVAFTLEPYMLFEEELGYGIC